MESSKKYKSYSFNPFTLWKMIYLILLLPSLLILIVQINTLLILLFLALLIAAIFYFIIDSYSEVTIVNNNVIAKDQRKTLLLNDIKKVSTWWTYGFGTGSIEMEAEGTTGKSRPLINKIYIYAKFENDDDEIILCEQIYFGNKFPNNHNYSIDNSFDTKKLIRVSDIDKCLAKLEVILGNGPTH